MSPEPRYGGPSPEPTPAPKSHVEQARDDLVAEALEESTTLGFAGHFSRHHASRAEPVYVNQETRRLSQEAADRASGTTETKSEILRKAAEGVVDSQVSLARADAAAAEARLQGQGKGKLARLISVYRHNKAVRYGITAVATVGAVGLAASGLGAAAIGLKLAHGGLRATAGYFGLREGIDKAASMKDYRSEKRVGPARIEHGRLHIPEASKDEMLAEARKYATEPGEVIARMVELQSPHNKAYRSPEQAQRAEAWLDALRQAEVERVHKQLEDRILIRPEGSRVHLREGILAKLPDELKAVMDVHMLARREQIFDDKRSLRLRKGAALAVAGVLFASGAAGLWLHHVHDSIGRPGSGGVASAHALELHRHATDQFGSAGEVYDHSNYVVSEIRPGQSPMDALTDHLDHVQEYLALDPEARKAVREQLVGHTLRSPDGKRWHIATKVMAAAIKHNQ